VAPLAAAVSRIAATALCRYLRTIGPSLRISFLLPDGYICNGENPRIHTFLDEQRAKGPVIYALWIRDHVSLLSIGFASPFFRRLAQEFAFVADDSFGGLVMQSAVSSLGAKVLPVSVQDPATRLRSLRTVVQERASTFLAVDGHGPYFTVSPGLVSLAKSIGAAVVPFAALAEPSVSMTNLRVSVSLPLPKSYILGSFGEPFRFNLDPHSSVKSVDLVGALAEALNGVLKRAETVHRQRKFC
jgi:lysophospholipid acyltransferase (LPLAT)-like uncharacterized protein